MSSNEILNCIRASFIRYYGDMRSDYAVVGLSGGVDSAVVAKIVADIVGSHKVKLFYLPYKCSSKKSFIDASIFAEKFKLNLATIEISDIADTYFKNYDNLSRLRVGNFLSRIRMNILFDKAAENNGVVIGTSNKTELLLGYGTWYGDLASSINPIGDLYKFQIYELANALDIPDEIVNKAPTADLWENQTDESELGYSYQLIDRLLLSIIEKGHDKKKLYEEFGNKMVDEIVTRVRRNSFKRSLPPICKIEKNDRDIEIIFKSL